METTPRIDRLPGVPPLPGETGGPYLQHGNPIPLWFVRRCQALEASALLLAGRTGIYGIADLADAAAARLRATVEDEIAKRNCRPLAGEIAKRIAAGDAAGKLPMIALDVPTFIEHDDPSRGSSTDPISRGADWAHPGSEWYALGPGLDLLLAEDGPAVELARRAELLVEVQRQSRIAAEEAEADRTRRAARTAEIGRRQERFSHLPPECQIAILCAGTSAPGSVERKVFLLLAKAAHLVTNERAAYLGNDPEIVEVMERLAADYERTRVTSRSVPPVSSRSVVSMG